MPCYRCGVRQTDPERGKSPWRRGVLRDQLVLVCPACQESSDWTAELQSCARCASVHLIRRLGQLECLDCGLIREPGPALATATATATAAVGGRGAGTTPVGTTPAGSGRDPALADEVGRALDRLLGRG